MQVMRKSVVKPREVSQRHRARKTIRGCSCWSRFYRSQDSIDFTSHIRVCARVANREIPECSKFFWPDKKCVKPRSSFGHSKFMADKFYTPIVLSLTKLTEVKWPKKIKIVKKRVHVKSASAKLEVCLSVSDETGFRRALNVGTCLYRDILQCTCAALKRTVNTTRERFLPVSVNSVTRSISWQTCMSRYT